MGYKGRSIMYIAYTDNQTGFNAIKNSVNEWGGTPTEQKNRISNLYASLHKDEKRFYFYLSYEFFKPYTQHRYQRSKRCCIRGL